MRASLIALIALVASPLMVFAAPSSQIGSLAERDTVPPGGNALDNLDVLTTDQIADRILALPSDKAYELANKLSFKQALALVSLEDLFKSNKIIEKVGGAGKFKEILAAQGA